MKIRNILFLITIILSFSSISNSLEKIEILLKINNKIITNVDIQDEYRYLLVNF